MTNGGFESAIEYGDPAAPNWFAFFGGGSTGTLSTSQDEFAGTPAPFEGDHHLIIGNSNAEAGFSGVFQRVAAAENTEYTFDFQARSEAATFGIGAEYRLEYFDASLNLLGATGNVQFGTDLNDSYQAFSITDTSLAGTAFVQTVIAVTSPDSAGNASSLFVDGASLTAIPEPGSLGLLGLFGLGLVARRRR